MFPGFWYAGQPIGMRIGPVFTAVWRFFVASAGAGLVTALIVNAIPNFARAPGASAAFLRMLSVSLLFFGLYLVGVIALYNGFKPLNETAVLVRELLPERMFRREFPAAADTGSTLSRRDRT
jgi:hypothetical protein